VGCNEPNICRRIGESGRKPVQIIIRLELGGVAPNVVHMGGFEI